MKQENYINDFDEDEMQLQENLDVVDNKQSIADMRLRAEFLSVYADEREVFDSKTNYATKIYRSKNWQNTRDKVVERDCEYDMWAYLKTGELIPIDVCYVHHIIPILDVMNTEDEYLIFDMGNLITVSASSHREIEALYNKGKDKKALQEILLKFVRSRNINFKNKENFKCSYDIEVKDYDSKDV